MMSGRIRLWGEVEVSEPPAVAAPEPGAPAADDEAAAGDREPGAPQPGAAGTIAPAPTVRGVPPGTPLGRLGPLLFAGHLSWALPANAAGTLLQALFAEQRADTKVAAAAF